MLINKKEIIPILSVLKNMRNNENVSVLTKYKVLKIEKELKEEQDMIISLLEELIEKYGERDEENNLLFDAENKVPISTQYEEEVEKQLNDFYAENIQIQDIYFSEDEVETFNLTYDELSIFFNFIKI